MFSTPARSCGKPGYPGHYTKVSYFQPWIMDIIDSKFLKKYLQNMISSVDLIDKSRFCNNNHLIARVFISQLRQTKLSKISDAKPVCLQKISDMSGNISSPGWPDRYENNAFCRWEFTTPKGMVIKVNNASSIDAIMCHCANSPNLSVYHSKNKTESAL